MPFIFQADVWCDQCGQRIIDDLNKHHAGVPDNPSDESNYDSDNFPKRYYPDSEQADSPQNCASGNCADAPFPWVYGRFLENGLTPEGYKYLQNMLNGHGATLHKGSPQQEWADFYQFTYFNNPWDSAHDWLDSAVQDHAAQIQDRDGGNTHTAALVSILNELAAKVSGDDIQDLFQSDMDDDDYFKSTGWYSPEME